VAVSFIGGGNLRSTRRKPPTHFITYCCIEYTSPSLGISGMGIVDHQCLINADCPDKPNNHEQLH